MNQPNVPTSAEFIAHHAIHVKIDGSAIQRLATELALHISSGAFGVSKWLEQELTPNEADSRAIDWIFVTDLLNFSFWTDGPAYEVVYNHKVYTGYWSLCAAVNRAIEEGIDLLDANTYQHISASQFRHIFRSRNGVEIPLLDERLRILREAGKTLVRNFSGSFLNVVEMCERSALKLLDLLCEYFPSFQDTAIYKDNPVSFLKRAQILVGDLWSCFNGEKWGEFYDIEQITAFADYRVPQVLNYFGVLVYDEELLQMLHNGTIILNGSELEVEIRGNTIHAVQLLVQKIKQILSQGQVVRPADKTAPCNAVLVDNYLWLYRREHAADIDRTIPMHRTRCIFY